jgi:hypothetical protein
MKTALTVSLLLALCAAQAHAQSASRIWRCGSTYTNVNSEAEARAQGCKPLEGGNVTIVEGTRVNNPPASAAPAPVRVAAAMSSAAGTPRIDAGEQRARDTEARSILEAELKKAQTRHAELLKEFNNGEPEKLGPETRNHQKYLDRVADLKASIARNENDIAGIQRELARLPAAK